MKKVALLSMPFGAHRIPKLSIALLKGYLKQSEIPCDVHLFDLQFAFQIGLDNYEIIAENFNPALLIGDWLFSQELFGVNKTADKKYIDLLLSDIIKKKDEVFLPGILKIFEVRDKIPGFLRECLDSVDWSKYSIAGFSASNQQSCACLALAKHLKQTHPHLKIVFGGASCSGTMAEALMRSFPFIDYACQGEGDISFPILVKGLLEKENIDTDSIPGMLSRAHIKSGFNQEKSLSVQDMDSLAYPDFSEYFSFLKDNADQNTFEVQIPLETSRGCWWGQRKRCVFCGHCFENNMAFKSKSPSRVMEEVEYLSDKYNSTFRMSDDIMDYNYYRTLLPAIAKKKQKISFFWEVKANISKEHMAILSKAGVKRIQPGIESFGNNILKAINKGTTQLINVSTLKWAKEFGVHVSWNLLYGFPCEDYAEYEEMIQLMPLLRHLEPPVGFSHVRLERFSSYVNDPDFFKIKNLHSSKVYNLVYPGVSQKNIQDMAFYFDAEYEDNSQKYEAKLIKAVEEWKETENAALDMFASDDSINIIDTRDPCDKREFFCRGLEAKIYLACDKAKSISLLLNDPQINEDSKTKETKSILDNFIKQGLMIEKTGEYLSLAVSRPKKLAHMRM